MQQFAKISVLVRCFSKDDSEGGKGVGGTWGGRDMGPHSRGGRGWEGPRVGGIQGRDPG